MAIICIYCTLRGRIKGTTSALYVIQHGLHGGPCYTAHDNGDSFSLSYTTNKAGKTQSTINHGKGRAVRKIMVLGLSQ